MRVGILAHGQGSGSTRAALDLAIALHARGVQTLLLTLGQPRWRVPRGLPHRSLLPEGGGLSVEAIDRVWQPAEIACLSQALAWQCRVAGIDVLNYHYGLPFAEACAGARAMLSPSPLRLIATLHGSDIQRAQGDSAGFDGFWQAVAAADAVVTVSKAYHARLAALAAGGSDCRMIPNFLPAARQVAVARPPLRRPPAMPTLVHVSSFRRVKQVRQVGLVFLALARRMPCRLILVGDGPERPALQAMLRAQRGRVRFMGRQDSSAAVLRQADLLLLASAAESFSLVALEAMAAGVPVVAPRIAGLCETVPHGQAGLLFAPNRPASAVLNVLRLIGSPALQRAMARNAPRLAARFDEGRSVEAYLALFAAVAG